jgi:hypothetical protein
LNCSKSRNSKNLHNYLAIHHFSGILTVETQQTYRKDPEGKQIEEETTMIGIKDQAFGLELEFTGITRRRAAKAIAQVINGNPYYRYDGGGYKKCTVVAADGREWIVEYDSSITVQGGEECEFVTPKCTYADIPKIQDCIRALRKAGAKVNNSCGMHIHIDGANHTAKSLKNLAFTFRAKQDLIFDAAAPERKSNRYCKPITDDLVDNIKKLKKLDAASMKDTWYDTYRSYTRSTSSHYHDSRYHALNLHSLWYRGTVEFRLFRATLHAGEVRACLSLCLAMSAAAINAKRASAETLDNGNPKYAMRCWLLRLGFIGDEWTNVRKHLLKNLEGNAAWRNDPATYASYNNRTTAATTANAEEQPA